MSSARVERAACCLGGNRSIHLSYENMIKHNKSFFPFSQLKKTGRKVRDRIRISCAVSEEKGAPDAVTCDEGIVAVLFPRNKALQMVRISSRKLCKLFLYDPESPGVGPESQT